MREYIIYDKYSLRFIIDACIRGLVGLEEDVEIFDLIITYVGDNEKFKDIVIKPTRVDITKDVVQTPTFLNKQVNYIETELVEYIVYTVVEEENESGEKIKTLVNASLTEYVTMFDSIDSIMNMNDWKLSYIK